MGFSEMKVEQKASAKISWRPVFMQKILGKKRLGAVVNST